MHSVALHRGGMLRILRGSVHPEGDRGNVEENEDGENEHEKGDQRENQDLSALFPECFHTVPHEVTP